MSGPREEAPGPSESPPPGQSGPPAWVAFTFMGSTIATCLAVGVLGGIWFDGRFHTSPVGLLVGVGLGTVAAVVSVIQQVRRFL
ncbi:MAG: AtpZ/AtpI family protein [Acidobacteriota bacterium]|nr:AtpZ/AtpI family protein [Acidobacteriota bacterium]